MGNIFENSSFFQVLLLVRRSTRIRGRKKRHGNEKSVFLAISGQNGYILIDFNWKYMDLYWKMDGD